MLHEGRRTEHDLRRTSEERLHIGIGEDCLCGCIGSSEGVDLDGVCMRESLPWMVEAIRNLGTHELAAEERMRRAARTIEIIFSMI